MLLEGVFMIEVEQEANFNNAWTVSIIIGSSTNFLKIQS